MVDELQVLCLVVAEIQVLCLVVYAELQVLCLVVDELEYFCLVVAECDDASYNSQIRYIINQQQVRLSIDMIMIMIIILQGVH